MTSIRRGVLPLMAIALVGACVAERERPGLDGGNAVIDGPRDALPCDEVVDEWCVINHDARTVACCGDLPLHRCCPKMVLPVSYWACRSSTNTCYSVAQGPTPPEYQAVDRDASPCGDCPPSGGSQ